MIVEPRRDVFGHDRHQHEQAPHAVDDRGNAGQQFDGGADRAAQRGATSVRKKAMPKLTGTAISIAMTR
jgi:hypothetical protein